MAKNKLNKKVERFIEHEQLPVVFDSLTRRMFFRNSMGFFAIPLIIGLLPKRVLAQGVDENSFRKAVFMLNRHGGYWLDTKPSGVNYSQVANGVKAGSLNGATLGAIYSDSYRSVQNKLSVLIGLDSPGACGHTMATSLAGSYANFRSATVRDKLDETSSINRNSIDVLIANKIYANSHPLKVLRFGGTTHCFQNGANVGGISVGAAYDRIISNLGATSSTSNGGNSNSGGGAADDSVNYPQRRRKFLLETILSGISQTKNSSRIRDQATKTTVGDFQDLLSQIKNSIVIPEPGETSTEPAPVQPPGQACTTVDRPNGSDDRAKADLMVAALKCGVTRLGYMGLPYEHGYVHNVHQLNSRTAHKNFLRSNLDVCGYLMNQMDSLTDANGKTMLENSCVLVSSDLASSKFDNHTGVSMRVLVGGGLNGKFRMGQAIDYEGNGTKLVQSGTRSQIEAGGGMPEDVYAGRVYNELLVSILKAFGLNQSDYAHDGRSGFGHYHVSEVATSAVVHDLHLRRDETQLALNDYMKNVYLRNYNRDSTLPYYYTG